MSNINRKRWPNIIHGMHSSLAVETAWSLWCVAYNNVVYVPADKAIEPMLA